ncbi:MAG: hypothetical protein V1746_02540 [bacterium]
MDEIVKSFSLSFYLRSVFSGVFFIISFCVAAGTQITGITEKEVLLLQATGEKGIFHFGTGLLLALTLTAGVIVYALHRSLAYPWFEHHYNATWAQTARKKGAALISKNSIEDLKKYWNSQAKPQENCSKDDCQQFVRAEKFRHWADYAHLHYTSAWCIILGALSGSIIHGEWSWKFVPWPPMHWPLFSLTIVFFVAAVVSDWRLHSTRDLIEDENDDEPMKKREIVLNIGRLFLPLIIPVIAVLVCVLVSKKISWLLLLISKKLK